MPSSDLSILGVAPGRPLAAALARQLLAEFPDPIDLSRVRLLLPARRALRTMRSAFLAATDGATLLLPRMAAIGDPDEDEALGLFAEDGAEALALPPAMPPLVRRLALARLLARFAPAGPASALALADSLGRVIDRLTVEGIDPAQLAALDLPGLADHWQRNRDILATVARQWPALLHERGQMDAVARREQLLGMLADRWRRDPPGDPVIAAGFAAAPPGVARLLGVVARMPRGRVVLAAFPQPFDSALAETLAGYRAPTHPHAATLRLLEDMGANPDDVRPFPGTTDAAAGARAAAVVTALLPATLADRWQAPLPPLPPGLRLVTAAGPEEEALVAALALRRALEVPGRTALFATPSRSLARRVAGELARFGIDIDDSAGTPLSRRPAGTLMLALADAAAGGFRPSLLVALGQLPLAGGDDPERRAVFRDGVRALDLALRGPPPPPGLDGLAQALAPHPQAAAFLAEHLAPCLAPLVPLFGATPPTLAALVAALTEAAQRLAGDALWSGEDGRGLARVVADITAAPDAAALPVPAPAAVATLRPLIDSVTVRPPWRQHPRVAILGLLEARLEHADLVVLGGLDEGVWPPDPPVDPWLAPTIRGLLGLPPAEERIGRMAHDLLSATAAGELLLTRARRDDRGSATVPSRFLLRLEAVYGPLPGDAELLRAAALDGGTNPRRMARPAPAPPAADRPRQLTATDADLLAADPFAWFAKRMLRLQRLEPLEAPLDGAVRGSIVHSILQAVVGRPDPLADATPLIDAELARLPASPALALFWRPRLVALVAHAQQLLAANFAAGWRVAGAEVPLRLEWRGIALVGKADRIDQHSNGALRIVDYKTGTVPTKAAILDGRARQLPFLRLLAEEGGHADVPEGTVTGLEYWPLSGGRQGKEPAAAASDVDRADFAAALAALIDLRLLGNAPFQPRVDPMFAPLHDYAQLARVEEWLGQEPRR